MKRPKYGNRRVEVSGVKFDSAKESRVYSELLLRQRAGEIAALELQPRFDIIINGKKCGFYKADFRYREAGNVVILDVKGFKTPVYKLKKKIIEAMYGITIVEV